MGRRRGLAVVLLVAATAAFAAPAPARSAVDATATTTVARISFSTSGFSLRGTQLRAVEVAVHLTDPDGVAVENGTWADGGIPCPCVILQNVRKVEKRSLSQQAISLHLADGTARDGVWVGRFVVGAAQAGFWQPRQIQAGDLVVQDGSITSLVAVPEPWREVTLNVRGTDWPYLWMGTRVRARPDVDVVRGGAYLVRSRTPVPAARVEIRDGCRWANGPHRFTAAHTDAAGRYAFTMRSSRSIDDEACAALAVYPSDELFPLVAISNLRTLTPLR